MHLRAGVIKKPMTDPPSVGKQRFYLVAFAANLASFKKKTQIEAYFQDNPGPRMPHQAEKENLPLPRTPPGGLKIKGPAGRERHQGFERLSIPSPKGHRSAAVLAIKKLVAD